MTKSIKYDGLQIDYQGETIDYSADSIVKSVRYKGTEEQCKKFAEEHAVGYVDDEYGTVKSIRVTQSEGPFWHAEVLYSTTTVDGMDWATGTVYGPTHSVLTCRTMDMPLQKRKNYRTKWDHFLFGHYQYGNYIPDFWDSATDYQIPGNYWIQGVGYAFKWGVSSSECPENYIILKQPIKAGVDSYIFPTYELTEYCKVNSMSNAGFFLRHRAQSISKPEHGDFGIQERFGGNWLCIGGDIKSEGSSYIVSLTYLYSFDGWDEDIYDKLSDE